MIDSRPQISPYIQLVPVNPFHPHAKLTQNSSLLGGKRPAIAGGLAVGNNLPRGNRQSSKAIAAFIKTLSPLGANDRKRVTVWRQPHHPTPERGPH